MAGNKRAGLRLTNRRRVLQELFNHEATSRAEIASRLNLNKSTVSSLYNELQAEGFIEELGSGESTKSGGRRPNLIRLNREYGFVASFEIGTSHLRAMFNYLNGEIISFREIDLPKRDILAIMQLISAELDRMLSHNTTLHGLLAIGFSIHGVIVDNRITDSPFIELGGIDLEQYYQDKYAVPVVLANEANMAAVFERDFGASDRYDNLVTISIHRGIGAGIIANQRLYAGNEGFAGEIGRSLVVEGDYLVKVEDVCSEGAVLSKVQRVKQLPNISIAKVAELYHQGDRETVAIVDEMVNQLGKVTYNAMINYGPRAVYFNAPIMEAIPEIYHGVKQWVAKMALPSQISLAMIHGSKMASLLGAGSVAIHVVLGMMDYSLILKWPKEVKNVE